jgi:plastocyanin domain-containing protein
MFNKTQVLRHLVKLGLLISMASTIPITAATAAEASRQTSQFRQIQQPLGLKLGVALGGAALIGLELWWFLLSKPSQTTVNQDADR